MVEVPHNKPRVAGLSVPQSLKRHAVDLQDAALGAEEPAQTRAGLTLRTAVVSLHRQRLALLIVDEYTACLAFTTQASSAWLS